MPNYLELMRQLAKEKEAKTADSDNTMKNLAGKAASMIGYEDDKETEDSIQPTNFPLNLISRFVNDKETADSIEPTTSVIDLLAGAAGAKLGSGMLSNAGTLLGNEIGAVGSDVVSGVKTKILPGNLANKAAQSDQALNSVVNSGDSMDELRRAMQIAGRDRSFAQRLSQQSSDVASEKQRFGDLVKKLRK